MNNEKIAQQIMKEIEHIIDAHTNHTVKPSKAFRKADKTTPYFFHPLWCAASILFEPNLDKKTKEEGYFTLLYHDILEDTTRELPEGTTQRIRKLVEDMTYEGGTKEEMIEVWNKPPVIRLYKLFDKVSNIMDGRWMKPEKKEQYHTYTAKLCDDVEQNYGELNITLLARAIIDERRYELK